MELKKFKQLKKELSLLDKKAKVIEEKLDKLELERARERRSKLIGNCYKYGNMRDSDNSWWVYSKVVGVSEYNYQVLTVEKPLDKRVIIELKEREDDLFERKISLKEFDKALKIALDKDKLDLSSRSTLILSLLS